MSKYINASSHLGHLHASSSDGGENIELRIWRTRGGSAELYDYSVHLPLSELEDIVFKFAELDDEQEPAKHEDIDHDLVDDMTMFYLVKLARAQAILAAQALRSAS